MQAMWWQSNIGLLPAQAGIQMVVTYDSYGTINFVDPMCLLTRAWSGRLARSGLSDQARSLEGWGAAVQVLDKFSGRPAAFPRL
jgi:hypothetical protein